MWGGCETKGKTPDVNTVSPAKRQGQSGESLSERLNVQ